MRIYLAAAVASCSAVLACGAFGSASTGADPDDGGAGASEAAATESGAPEGGLLIAGTFEDTTNGGCGDFTFDRAQGAIVSPGHTSASACRVCENSGLQVPIDVYMHSGSFAIAHPVRNARYHFDAWVRAGRGTVDLGRPLFELTAPDGGTVVDEGSERPTVTSAWSELSLDYVASGSESGLSPGLHFQVEPTACVDVDDFTLAVSP